ncbi:hypothetical protein E3N88_32706 [Mikania micrantha]|uniref:Uncharacterized protein n=1 Tax=Mikania micrantha TaxID=192012 RepID=A0A5N6M9U1_9ASTR|nr:hypothetical protein E3N88_32706 [Mikania micrantha]
MFFFTLLLTLAVSSTDPAESSPSPSPSPSPPPQSGSDGSILDPSSYPPPPIASPPAPPPSDLSHSTSSDGSLPPASAPTAIQASDVSAGAKSEEPKESSSDGMSGGKKVGIAFGLIAAACAVIVGGVLYRKRRQNLRRAKYNYISRADLLKDQDLGEENQAVEIDASSEHFRSSLANKPPKYLTAFKVFESTDPVEKPYVEAPPSLELKSHLEYAFLDGDSDLTVIISSSLTEEEKSRLIDVLKANKQEIAWKH